MNAQQQAKFAQLTMTLGSKVENGTIAMEAIEKFINASPKKSQPVKAKWIVAEDGTIRFSVKSDGTTGEQWIKRLESKGFLVGDDTKSILLSKKFKASAAGTITEIVVIMGADFSNAERITSNIRTNAAERKFLTPQAEVACLIREMFSDEELKMMGLWRYIVVMHERIENSDGNPSLLGADQDVGGEWLLRDYDVPDCEWPVGGAFVFAASQVSFAP